MMTVFMQCIPHTLRDMDTFQSMTQNLETEKN